MIPLVINNLITIDGIAVLVVVGWSFHPIGTWT
jgi:hypothetical protein